MRRVLFVTGARSDYDLMIPVIRAAEHHPGLEPEVLPVAGHLSPFHGLTLHQVEEDGVALAGRVESLLAADGWSGRSLSFGHLVIGLTHLLAQRPPDLLYLAGDREEALAAALVGNFLRIPVAHAHGGDRCLASDLDEVLRPAISKLAHLHFTATEGHRERLIRMGEPPAQVFAVGAAGLDRFLDEPGADLAELAGHFGQHLEGGHFLVIFHPTPTLPETRDELDMEELLEGVLALGRPVFCSYPNFDPGNLAVRSAIDRLRAAHPQRLVTYHNLPRRLFVGLFRHAGALVGNSSSLLLEAGFLKKPAILVGPRQDLRERGPNVLRVEAQREAVRGACERALGDREFLHRVTQAPSLYGDGHSAGRIVQVLAEHPLGAELLAKTICY